MKAQQANTVMTNPANTSSKNLKNNTKKKRDAVRVVVEPSVTREQAATTTRKTQPTPDQRLTAAGLASPSDRGRSGSACGP